MLYENEKKLTKVFFDLEKRGILVDTNYVREALIYEQGQIKKAKEDFETDTGRAYKDSPKLFAEIFTERGESFPTAAKGNPSFKAEVLEHVDSPTARIIRLVREHEKRAGTYYSAFLAYTDSNSRIHANIRQAGTKTGRLSYSNPNLQNVPKEDEEEDLKKEFIVRGSFIPPPGYVFGSLDYSQAEYKLMLDYAGEMQLIKKVLEGADLHQATADMVGISRKYAKTLNFAILYGAGIEKIAAMLGMSVREASQLRQKYFGRLPKVARFIRRVINTGKARGYVINWIGRRCYIPNRNFAYALPNHLIQGGVADIIKLAMPQIHELLRKYRSGMVVQIHDDILSEIHENEIEVLWEMKNIMENVYVPRNGMKLTTDPEISKKSWAYRDFEGLKC